MANRMLLRVYIGGIVMGGFLMLPLVALSQSVPVPPAPARVNAPPSAVALPAFPVAPKNSVAPSPSTPIALPVISPSPVAAAPPAPAPATPATITPPAPQAAVSAVTESPQLYNKEPGYFATPLHMGNISLLFPRKDIDVVRQLLEFYDNATNAQKQATASSGNDDLNNLLKELTAKHGDTNAPVQPVVVIMPNVYLSSIVYYSPSHWSVWINDKKLVNKNNIPANEFYVTRISRTQIEVVWKPKTMLDTVAKWKERTGNGKNPLPGITVDEAKGTITLLMRPNQTFLPRSLAIQEGFIKTMPQPAAPAPAP